MATKPRKIKATRSPTQLSLASTRLKKLSVEAIGPPEKGVKGRLISSFSMTITLLKDEDIVLAQVELEGKGLFGEGESDVAFTFDAAIDGIYPLLGKIKEQHELDGHETYMANRIVPLLSDIVETMLSRCGYRGITLPRSLQNLIKQVDK